MRSPIIQKEYLGAFKRGHRASAKEFIDEEFSLFLLKKAEAGCKESKDALLWLTKFNNEFHKAVIKKGDETALHKTDELRRDCNKRNYARRNDLYGFVTTQNYDCLEFYGTQYNYKKEAVLKTSEED